MKLNIGWHNYLVVFLLLALKTAALGQTLPVASEKDSLSGKKNQINSIKENKVFLFKKQKGKSEVFRNDTLQKNNSISNGKSAITSKKDEYSQKNDTTKTNQKSDSSLTNTLKSKAGIKSDSTKRKISVPKLSTKGTVSVGYDYGVIPFIVNNKVPAGFFKTEGNVGFEIFKLPLIASFYYADVRNVSGLNNYFRVSFDANKFKENLVNQRAGKQQAAKGELTKLYGSKQQLEQKLLYLKSQQNQPNLNNLGLDQFTNYSLPKDSLSFPSFPNDSVEHSGLSGNGYNFGVDSSKIKQLMSDSLLSHNANIQKADSINQKINDYEQQIKEVQDKIEKVQQTINMLQNPDASEYSHPPTSKPSVQNFFSYVKKLDIGLCYPNYSAFLINGSAVRGINMELQKGNTFFAFTHGKTINNLLFSNSIVQNNLQNTRNLYNFFDFNNVKDSRRITAFKIGYGGLEETHLHLGFLYGVGLSSYINNNYDPSGASNTPKEKNYVFELDGKYVINPNNSFDAAYGKSSIQQEGVNYPDGEKGFAGIFNSSVRSNAALSKFNTFIPKTKTKITLLSRLVDPFFRSYGVGFMRSDNFRYEIKVEQPITRKIKIGGSYRKDQDNILNMYLVKTTLQTIGSNITFRVSKQLTIRASYTPVLQKVRSKDNSIHFDNRNYISNVIVSWTPKLKKITSSFNALYNYYQLYDGVRNNIYQNYALTNVTSLGAVKNEFSANMFYSNNIDTLNGSIILLTDYVSFFIKKCSITAGVKWAQSEQFKNQLGYKLKVNIPLSKYIAMELSGEKIVMGDFYNSYPVGDLNKFPYYCYGKLIINW